MQLLCQGAVDAALSSFLRRLQEHGKDGEENGHEGGVSGQVRVDGPWVDRVHRHLGTCDKQQRRHRLLVWLLRPSALAQTLGLSSKNMQQLVI